MWITPQNQTLDDTFDPYFPGTTRWYGYTGILINNTQDTYDRYAPLQYGRQAPSTAILAQNQVDLNQIYAARGTAGYLQGISIPNCYVGCSGVTINDLLAARCTIIIKNDGTWQQWFYSTNYKTDSPGAYAPPNRGIPRTETNFSNGRMNAAGNWAQIPFAGVGNNYETFCHAPWAPYESKNPPDLDWGTADHYNRYDGALINYIWHNFKGQGQFGSASDPYVVQNTTQNPNEDIPDGRVYRIDRDIRFTLGLTAQGRNNVRWNYDDNGALSWYNRANFSVYIQTPGGGQRVGATCLMTNEIRWNAWNWTGGSVGGGGGGGGGGCVAATSYVDFQKTAGTVEAGDYLMGMTDDLQFMELHVLSVRRQVQPCVRLYSKSGVTLVCSKSTPLTLQNGDCVLAGEARAGIKLPVRFFAADPEWETIIKIEEVGNREVMLINCGGQSYAAGELPGRYIYTHNNNQQKM